MHFDKKAQIRNSRRVKHTITAQGQHVQTTLGACLTVPYSALQCLTASVFQTLAMIFPRHMVSTWCSVLL
jgi:hypothetical protein